MHLPVPAWACKVHAVSCHGSWPGLAAWASQPKTADPNRLPGHFPILPQLQSPATKLCRVANCTSCAWPVCSIPCHHPATWLSCPVSDVSPAPAPSPTPEAPVDGGDPTTNTKTASTPASGTGGEEVPARCQARRRDTCHTF
jgi:hypothetical protein